MIKISDRIQLASGVILKNRLAKAAMSESMAKNAQPGVEFQNCYRMWAQGGAGLVITGNVMVDANHLGEINNVVLDESVTNLSLFRDWAMAAVENQTAIYMQLNHPGKQTPKFITEEPVAPSSISFPKPMSNMFNCPRALSEPEIQTIIKKFGIASLKAKEAGFSGVQIHGAHGYLVSQFLSPRHNQRTDEWGGSLDNRFRFLKMIIIEIRSQVGHDFGLALKLNSADFQKGGFTKEDSLNVLEKLNEFQLDFIEISGGTYEVNAMMGSEKSKKRSSREAYFIDYAKMAKKVVSAPLMLTGGFQDLKTIESALASGDVDIVGMARAFAINPALAKDIIEKKEFSAKVIPKKTGIKIFDQIVPFEIVWYAWQIHLMGQNKAPNKDLSVWTCLAHSVYFYGSQILKRTRAIAA